MAKKTNKKPTVFTPNPIAKPLKIISYAFPTPVTNYLNKLWYTPLNIGKGLYIPSLKANATQIIDSGVTPIYGYGNGNKHIVLMHGWNARGGQLRKFIEPLVAKGFKVWWFDGPGFGDHPAKKSNAYYFARTLVDVHKQIITHTNQPIFATISHSVGCLANLLASDPTLFDSPIQSEKVVWIAPSLSPTTMFNSFCNYMQVRPSIKKSLYTLVEKEMFDILQEDPWKFFSKQDLFKNISHNRFLMYDQNDEEIVQSDFESIESRFAPNVLFKTDHLGHYNMLRDSLVINKVTQYIVEEQGLQYEQSVI